MEFKVEDIIRISRKHANNSYLYRIEKIHWDDNGDKQYILLNLNKNAYVVHGFHIGFDLASKEEITDLVVERMNKK